MGADELIEERPEVNHCLAEILRARLAAAVTDDDFATRAVVVHHCSMFDREIIQTVSGILDRVAARTHHVFDQVIGLIHSSTRLIDESRLNRTP